LTGAPRIAVARSDGTGAVIYPDLALASDRTPRWVSDSTLILSSDRGGSQDLWYLGRSGAVRRLSSFAGEEWTPVPRPGNPGVVYVEGTDPLSGRLVLIPDTAAAPLGRIYLTPPGLRCGEPDWSPDGLNLSFTAAGLAGSRAIWRLSTVDTVAIQITVAVGQDRSPRWSPDGSRILFASNRLGRWGIWTVDRTGEGASLVLLAQDVAGAELRHPAWSPDGTAVVVSSDRSGTRDLWKLTQLPP
jgi:Tol biopolymer transport system component